jgi:hypothetical protein
MLVDFKAATLLQRKRPLGHRGHLPGIPWVVGGGCVELKPDLSTSVHTGVVGVGNVCVCVWKYGKATLNTHAPQTWSPEVPLPAAYLLSTPLGDGAEELCFRQVSR